MKKLKSNQIRQMWLDFWKTKGHMILPGASLIPVDDPSLLWINAGVAPLKKFFDGREVPISRRIANAQKAIRTNDIDNVGRTARHHTFFEMLGNFSVGDYFRKEVLAWAFELLTSDKWFAFDVDKLYFTVYEGDKESASLWEELGVDASHIIPLKSNFWEIGEGPCGPDSEVFYDRGEKYDPNHLGLRLLREEIENDRYIEIWNIVFSQFNARTGVKREDYEELPSKNIDTGMGLERITCIMQETETNYETDLFMPYLKKLEEITGIPYNGQMAFKVISDHIRSVTFATSDGAMFANVGRGYVLRRLLRRAVRYGRQLGMKEPFLYLLSEEVCSYMSDFYPSLSETKEIISKIIRHEEEKFFRTLENGERKLEEYLQRNEDRVIPGDFVFKLYDTFGFPPELTEETAGEVNREIDWEGFSKELLRQREQARKTRREEQSMNIQSEEMLAFHEKSTFIGYDCEETKTIVKGIFKDGNQAAFASGKMILVFRRTVFYPTGGGQHGDGGYVIFRERKYPVLDSFRLPNGQPAVTVETDIVIKLQDRVRLEVDGKQRKKTASNHSATHLLNEALRRTLGSHVVQHGSGVSAFGLRFDFNHFFLPDADRLTAAEDLVNEEINKNIPVVIEELPLEEARKKGFQAVFGEKYGKIVRTVTIGFSAELCGGTHVCATGDIGRFAILGCESKGSGIYRIEAVTGSVEEVMKAIDETTAELTKETEELKTKIDMIRKKAAAENIFLPAEKPVKTINEPSYRTVLHRRTEMLRLRNLLKELDKHYQKARNEAQSNREIIPLTSYLKDVVSIGGTNVLITKTEENNVGAVKNLADRLCDRFREAVVFIAAVFDHKVLFVCKNRVEKLAAGELVRLATSITSGKGGGRSDFAQGGGKDASKTDEALEAVFKEVKDKLCG